MADNSSGTTGFATPTGSDTSFYSGTAFFYPFPGAGPVPGYDESSSYKFPKTRSPITWVTEFLRLFSKLWLIAIDFAVSVSRQHTRIHDCIVPFNIVTIVAMLQLARSHIP